MRRWRFWLFLLPLLALPAKSIAGPMEMMMMVGPIGELHESASGPAVSLDLAWVGNDIGGLWCEFGVLSRRSSSDLLFGAYNQSSQVLELSTGFILGAPSRSVFPYLRGGFGFYRDESDIRRSREYPYGLQGSEGWRPGLTMGIGTRVGAPGLTAAPNFEGRWHLMRPFEDDHETSLFTISAGLWFR